MKRVMSEAWDELDRITTLPVHLREFILECLPIKDAMRTSILSTSWRFCWIGMQHFDLEEMSLDTKADMEVFRKTVDRILLLHAGPIHSISFFFPENGNYMDINLSDWFHNLSKNGVRRVVADACNTGNQILLPHSLFQCSSLEYLVLFSFQISPPPPDFVGFNYLTNLVIISCTLSTDALESLISNCPLLGDFHLSYTFTTDNVQPLVISALNLTNVWFDDILSGTIIFQDVPRLRFISLMGSYLKEGKPFMPWDFISSIRCIEDIRFDIFLLRPEVGRCPKCLPWRFENLKIMSISSVNACVEDDLLRVLCMIRSAPCLQKLIISFQCLKRALFADSEESRVDAQKLLELEAK